MRYAHNVGKGLGLPPQSVALLAALFLRGPQTAGELRINSDRLHKFGDILSVEAFLNELAEKPFVRELAKQPGARETRWVHLLSGEPEIAAAEPAVARASASQAPGTSEMEAFRAEIAQLRAEMAELRAEVTELREAITSSARSAPGPSS
jgi:uncharacterized protein YceH (UPF0502 family)